MVVVLVGTMGRVPGVAELPVLARLAPVARPW
jgi:hypothetical protein